ncbi:MAG: hypothetical protein AAF220_01990 [Pseudomonadota bacterium]
MTNESIYPERPRPNRLPLLIFVATLGFAVIAGVAYQEASEERDNPHSLLVTETDPDALNRIVEQRRLVLSGLSSSDDPVAFARASAQYGEALTVRASLDGKTEDLPLALTAIDQALAGFEDGSIEAWLQSKGADTAASAQHLRALVYFKRGEVFFAMGESAQDRTHFAAAAEAFGKAAMAFEFIGDPAFVAMAQRERTQSENRLRTVAGD